jgi:hypothetical protein
VRVLLSINTDRDGIITMNSVTLTEGAESVTIKPYVGMALREVLTLDKMAGVGIDIGGELSQPSNSI